MKPLVIALFTLLASAAESPDPWAKVSQLRTGQELRIMRSGSTQPLVAKMDELTDESLVVIVKDRQTSIPRQSIERIDARPLSKGSRVSRESKTKTTYPENMGHPPTTLGGQDTGPSTNSSSTFSIGPKPDFETVYRKPLK